MLRKLIIFFILICYTSIYPSVAMDSSKDYNIPTLLRTLVKLGLEFQESSGLCAWALHDSNVQKKPLFKIYRVDNESISASPLKLKDFWLLKQAFPSVTPNDLFQYFISFYCQINIKNLFHVEIDGSDIEFVTGSFTDQERKYLKICIGSILSSLNVLKNILNASQEKETTFKKWTDSLQDYLNSFGLSFKYGSGFSDESLENMPIKCPSKDLEWVPVFSPQATIQHSLSLTIPLYFALFGFDSWDMIKFSASFPNREVFLAVYRKFEVCKRALTACEESDNIFQTPESKTAYKASQENFNKIVPNLMGTLTKMYQSLCSPLDGFVFLHALTLVSMTPIEYGKDRKFLIETLLKHEKYKQVDAKMYLNLMSRRPFSLMFKELLKKFNKPNFPYSEYFNKVIQSNNFKFRDDFDVPNLLNKVNYSEQFFKEDTGQPKDLSRFIGCFQEEFFDENKGVISTLLNQGIFGTAMLRNFKKDIQTEDGFPIWKLLDDFYIKSIETITKPAERYIVDTVKCAIIKEQNGGEKYDNLSPPSLLHSSNSMGKFKEVEMDEQDPEYGEAIIEVRGIRSVQSWFLQKAGFGLDSIGDFLVNPNQYLEEQVLGLFDFLSSFEDRFMNNKDKFAEEIMLNTMNAIKKY